MVSWPSKSRTPPNPKTSAIHPPAAEAMWTPSEAFPAASARSVKRAKSRYPQAASSAPISEATMLWMLADNEESPVVIGS